MARVLIVEPHSDDSCIGVGGFLLKNSSVHNYGFLLMSASDIEFIHAGNISREKRLAEYRDYVSLLGGEIVGEIDPLDAEGRLDLVSKFQLVGMVERAIAAFEPEVIVAQGPSFHHDHVATYEAVIAATRPTKPLPIKQILVMENPTYVHSPYPSLGHRPNTYVELDETTVDKKIDLFRNCFPSQVREDQNCLSPSGIKAWARYRGIEARCEYAEGLFTLFTRI